MHQIESHSNIKPFCFVLMPFSEDFDDRYSFGVKGACDEAGVYCERVDEQIFTGSILDRIYNQITKADVIVADMSGRNPNVFYEVGYAHALGKKTILVTSDAEDIPFDLKHFPHIVYGNNISILKSGILKRILKLAFGPVSAKEYEIGIELYWKGQSLSNNTVTVTHPSNTIPNAELTIHNNSNITYTQGEVMIAVEVPAIYPESRGTATKSTELPSGKWLHELPEIGKLFPDAYYPIKFYLDTPIRQPQDVIDVTVKVYTEAGSREFPLRLKKIEKDKDIS